MYTSRCKRAGDVLLIQTLHWFSINIPEKAACFIFKPRISHLNLNLKNAITIPIRPGPSGYDKTNEVGLEQEATGTCSYSCFIQSQTDNILESVQDNSTVFMINWSNKVPNAFTLYFSRLTYQSSSRRWYPTNVQKHKWTFFRPRQQSNQINRLF